MRKKRINIDCDQDDTSTATVSILTLSESEKSDCNKSSIVDNSAWAAGLRRISELGFCLCSKQKITPSDGNCMFHAISSQSRFTSAREARTEIVSNTYDMISKNIIFWDDSEHVR